MTSKRFQLLLELEFRSENYHAINVQWLLRPAVIACSLGVIISVIVVKGTPSADFRNQEIRL